MSVHRALPDVSSTDTEVKYGVAASAAMQMSPPLG